MGSLNKFFFLEHESLLLVHNSFKESYFANPVFQINRFCPFQWLVSSWWSKHFLVKIMDNIPKDLEQLRIKRVHCRNQLSQGFAFINIYASAV